jgi:hypothetical protein
MMAELHRLEVLLSTLGVKVEAHWISSAINRYADALSRQWDPGDTSATDALVLSLCDAYAPDAVVFGNRPVGLEPTLRPASDRHQESGGQWSVWRPDRATVAGTAVVRAADQVGDAPTRPSPRRNREVPSGPSLAEPQLGARHRRDRTTEAWRTATRDAVLTWTGASATGGDSVAADLLSLHCWSTNSWATWSSKWRKWERFCEHDNRNIFPASKGDVLAYIGFLRL